MSHGPQLAIDAMGGDGGPSILIEGVAAALAADPSLGFVLFGDEPSLAAECARHPALGSSVRVVHAAETISGEIKPSQAIRRSKNSSMGMAVAAVKAGEAHAAVSAGNTGALMAIAKLALRTIEGIDRPAPFAP